jgi:hypothetical protein
VEALIGHCIDVLTQRLDGKSLEILIELSVESLKHELSFLQFEFVFFREEILIALQILNVFVDGLLFVLQILNNEIFLKDVPLQYLVLFEQLIKLDVPFLQHSLDFLLDFGLYVLLDIVTILCQLLPLPLLVLLVTLLPECTLPELTHCYIEYRLGRHKGELPLFPGLWGYGGGHSGGGEERMLPFWERRWMVWVFGSEMFGYFLVEVAEYFMRLCSIFLSFDSTWMYLRSFSLSMALSSSFLLSQLLALFFSIIFFILSKQQ